MADKYRVEQVLAAGGMGVVIAATHLQLEQKVALKFMLPEGAADPETVERFAREARAAVRLKSEHVARILDVGTAASGSPYIVLEYLEGMDLAALLRTDGPVPVPAAADYIIQALDALAEAHAIGIVHRDLKPGNLFLTHRADGSAWIKVLDFGISRVDPPAAEVTQTLSQAIVGSPAYMSPEHLRSTRLTDVRSDIWSLGIILYELLCGKVPFTANAFSAFVLKVAMEPLPPLAGPHPVSEQFARVVQRCLEKEPDHRFQNAAELAHALAPFAPASAGPIVERIDNLTREQARALQLALGSPPAPPEEPAAPPSPSEPIDSATQTAPTLAVERIAPLPAPAFFGTTTSLRRVSLDWHERGRPRGVLAREDTIAEYHILRTRSPDALSDVEEAFVQAALRNATRRRRWKQLVFLAAFALLAAGATIFYRTDRESQRHLTRLYSERGRRAVLAGDPMRGLVYLGEAHRSGARGTAFDLVLGAAVRALGGETLVLADPGRSVGMPEFSPDGRTILTSGNDGIAQLWNASTGALLATIHGAGQRGWVKQPAFSADGQQIALRRAGSTIVDLYDAATGKRLRSLSGHTAEVSAIVFSPDSQRLLTASVDATTRIWSRAPGDPSLVLEGTSPVFDGDWSPDGERVAVATRDGTAEIWDVRSVHRALVLKGHTQPVRSVTFSPDGTQVATASWDSTTRIWDAETGALLSTVNAGQPSDSVVFTPDGNEVVTTGDRIARIWDARTGVLVHELEAHGGPVFVAHVSADGNRILTTGGDETARLWDARSGELVWTYVGAVWSATFDRSGTRVVAATIDGTARVWDARRTIYQVNFQGHQGPVPSARYSPDGKRVLTASYDRTIKLWDAETGRLLASSEPQKVRQGFVGWSPDGTRFLTLDEVVAKIWDVKTMKPLVSLVGHTGTMWLGGRAGFSRDGRRIVTGSADRTARLWDAATGRELRRLEGHTGSVNSAEFSPVADLVATASDDMTARLWDARTGALVRVFKGHKDALVGATFDRAGKRLLTTSMDFTARVWDVDTGELLSVLEGHAHQVNRGDFHPDGILVVTSSIDGTAKLWDAGTGQLIANIQQPWVGEATFSPDGSHILTASRNGTAKIWELPDERATPTPDEIQRFIRCRIPFRIDGDHLASAVTDPRLCRTEPARPPP